MKNVTVSDPRSEFFNRSGRVVEHTNQNRVVVFIQGVGQVSFKQNQLSEGSGQFPTFEIESTVLKNHGANIQAFLDFLTEGLEHCKEGRADATNDIGRNFYWGKQMATERILQEFKKQFKC